MATYYRVEIAAPTTKTRTAKTWTFTPESNQVQSITVTLQKEGKRISTGIVRLTDKKDAGQYWPIANSLPDPAFADIPTRIYLAKSNEGQSAAKLVMDGKASSYQAGYPGPSFTSVVAHDRSLDLRLRAVYRTFKNKTSVQVAQAIAQEYGFAVDLSELADAVTTQRAVEMGAGGVGYGALSDWHHITRALAIDGLELYTKGKKIAVRKSAQAIYPVTFKPSDDNTISLEVIINHVWSPGHAGQSKTALPAGSKGTIQSTTGSAKTVVDDQSADATMHRFPPQGAKASNKGAHTESVGDQIGPASQHRKRKDEATLTIPLDPAIGLHHLLNLSGWGGKFDGLWNVLTHKMEVSGGGPSLSVLTLQRGPSNADRKQVGAAVLPAGTANQ